MFSCLFVVVFFLTQTTPTTGDTGGCVMTTDSTECGEDQSGRPLAEQEQGVLHEHQWRENVGEEMGVWVSVADQQLRLIQGNKVLWEVACSTAKNGVGGTIHSLKTPPGWHKIGRKIGDDAPWGQVFRARAATSERWEPGKESEEDLVLTRILLLEGLEPGVNKGGNVDSASRYIYIHGTNEEDKVGEPVSHGCIRLTNDHVIEAYKRIPEGTRVLITPEGVGSTHEGQEAEEPE